MPEFRLAVTYGDGMSGTVDLSERLFGPIFEALNDPDVFAQAYIDEFGVICWPNGADLAPDALYEDIRTANSARQRDAF
jgi:hypothetical protein